MTSNTDNSASRLVADIIGNVQQILRAEVRLAALEVRAEVHKAKRAAVLFGAAAVVGTLGLGWLLFAAIQGLALVVAMWLAALIVSGLTLAAAGVLILMAGRQASELSEPMPRTRASLREIAQWKQTPEH